MMNFLKTLLQVMNTQSQAYPRYDEDGVYIDPKVAGLDDKTLNISAEKARILMSKAADELKVKERRKVFQKIHVAIKNGKLKVRLEANHVRPETLAYFSDLGYIITTITPPGGEGMRGMTLFDDEGDEVEGSADRPYFYYSLSWGEENPVVAPAVVSPAAETLAVLSTNG